MTLYIIRHGETRGNADGIVQLPHIELNQRGLEQARLAGMRLRAANITHILSSDYVRARMTTEQIQAQLPSPSIQITYNALLRERNFGDLRGRSHQSIGDVNHPELAPPNGETWPDFHRRIDQAWALIQQQALQTEPLGGNLAVVTHGLVCYSLALRHWPSAADSDHADIPGLFGNTSITTIDPSASWRIVQINCCQHLDTLNADRTSARSGV